MATLKQRITIQKISEYIRNNPSRKSISLGMLLKEVGYSESVSKSPQRVTETKGFKELLEGAFPNDQLLKIHKKLLNKQEIISYKGKILKTGQPHGDVKYALNLLYNLKNLTIESVPKEPHNYDLSKLTDKELELLEKLTTKIQL